MPPGTHHERQDERRRHMTIDLKLDKQDAEILQQVLDAYLSELRFEISNTDSFNYRSGLHKQEDRLKRMIGTLKAADNEHDLPASAER
jgi:hypothetical protein